jgi:acyl-coenzyme A thioesterase 9
MRLAYELGYSNASIFTRGVLRFLSLDEITFKHPVPIGCVLRLKSRIAHTVPTAMSSVVSLLGVGEALSLSVLVACHSRGFRHQ